MEKAINPQTGEIVFLVDNQWVKPEQTARNSQTGEVAYFVGNKWETMPDPFAKAAPKQTANLAEPTPGVTDPMGTGAAEIMAQPTTQKKRSVLEGQQLPPQAPSPISLGVDPKFVQGVTNYLDSLPLAERRIAAGQIQSKGGVYAQVVEAYAQRHKELDITAGSPVSKMLDPRLEARTERKIQEGLEAEGAAQEAAKQAMLGYEEQTPQMRATPEDVVRLQEEYGLRRDMHGIEETARVLKRTAAKGIGAGQQGYYGVKRAIADFTGLEDQDAIDKLNYLDARAKNMGVATSAPVRIFEDAAASIIQQAPAMIGGLLTGSEPLVLGNMFLQSFGQTYDEGRRLGMPKDESAARAGAYAAFEVLGEKIGLGAEMKALRASAKGIPLSDLAAYYAKALAKEIPGEELTYTGQFGVDKIHGVNKEAGIKDFINGAMDTAVATVAQAGMMFGGGAAANKAIRAYQERKEGAVPERTPYERDTSYEGLSEAIARAKGWGTPTRRPGDIGQVIEEPGRVEPTLEGNAPLAGEQLIGTEVPPAAPPAGVPEGYKTAQRENRINELTDYYTNTLHIPEEDARQLAINTVAQEEQAQIVAGPRLAAPENRVEEITQSLIDAGVEPTQARKQAVIQAQEEQDADNLAARTTVGEQPVPGADRTGVPVVGQPAAEPTAAGAGVTESTGVVPAEQTAGGVGAGEGEQPAPVDEYGKNLAGDVAPENINYQGTPPQVTVTAPAKRGRPAAPPEVKAAKAADKKTVNALNAKVRRAIDSATAFLDGLQQRIDDGDISPEDARTKRLETLRNLVGLQNQQKELGQGTSAQGKRLKQFFSRPDIRPQEIADLQKGYEATRAQQEKPLSAVKPSRGPVDTVFNKFTNAAQALSHIIKNGTKFEQKLAKRIRGFVTGVKFVVIEQGDPLPEQLQRHAKAWSTSIGMYVENPKTGERAVYLRGASYGKFQGINNTTVLHELLHAATTKKIKLAQEYLRKGIHMDSQVVKVYKDLVRTMNSAGATFNDAMRMGWLKNMPEIDVLSRAEGANIFYDPFEFVAYGLTDNAMQDFLMLAHGVEEDVPFFNRFVQSLRDWFGMDETDTNALTDLIIVTDKLLSTRMPGHTLAGEIANRMFGFGKEKPAEGIGTQETKVTPSANVERLAKMLGNKLYGTPDDIAKVSIKELFQNSFDAIKGAIEKGQLTKGKIDIKVDENDRTIRIIDNGLGMPAEVMGNQFLQIAGTVKETERASGGLGVAKMLFLFENKKLEVVSLRDGVLSRMVTTGDDLKAALNDPERGPTIVKTDDPKTIEQYKKSMFPEGHGTAVIVQVPESYVDSSTGETKQIGFYTYGLADSDVLRYSPLFDNIEVTFDRGYGAKPLKIGSAFPIDEYTPFANVKFEWGTARIYVSKEKVDDWDDNTHILSNGLWQFNTVIKDRPGFGGKQIKRKFYIDVSPNKNVKPEDPGYPFDLNRQRFSSVANNDFQQIFNYITVVYSQMDLAEGTTNFGTVQYVKRDGTVTKPQTLEPKAPATDNAFTMIKAGDKVEVRDGVLYVNNRQIPELSPDDLKNINIRIDELSIPQEEIDPDAVMIHDNTEAESDGLSISDVAREEFGDRFDRYLAEIGQTFMAIRTALIASNPGKYADLSTEAIGTSIDNEYYGVSIKLPFSGMFINPTITKRDGTPVEVALSMIGTMIHELAHFRERNHGAEFVHEMQDIMIALETLPGFNLGALKASLAKHIEGNFDIYKFLSKEFKDGNYKPRGNRFKESSYEQIPDEGAAGTVEGKRGAGEGQRPALSGITQQGAGAAGQVDLGEAVDREAEEVGEAVRSQADVDKAVEEAALKYAESLKGEGYAKAVTAVQMMQDPKLVIPFLRSIWRTLSRAQREALARISPTEFLADLASNVVPELARTNVLLEKMGGMANQLLKGAGLLATEINRAYKADPSLEQKLNELANLATLAEVDPADPLARERNKKLDEAYKALGREGQQVYKRIRDHFKVLSDYFSKLLDDQITNSGLPIAEQANLMKKIRAIYETGAKIAPYFPLVRYGDFWLRIGSGKNQKFFMFETEGERDRAMRGLASERIAQGGNESAAAYEKRLDELVAELQQSEEFKFGNSIAGLRSASADSSDMLKAVFQAIDSMPDMGTLGKEEREALKDSVYQIYLQTMPEQSFRRQFLHRKGYAGFSTDLLRNVATATTKMAIQLARLKYAPLLRNSLSQARDSIVNRPMYEPYVREMERRVAKALSTQPPSVAEQIVGWLNKASYIWYLGGVSSALLQPLSIIQTGLPVLMSQHNPLDVSREFGRMMKIWDSFGVYETLPNGAKVWVAPSMEHAKGISPDLRRAFQDMAARDLFTSTYAAEALDYKNTPRGKRSSGPILNFTKGTVDALVLGGLMHSTERISREVVGGMSYVLNRKKGLSHDDAVNAAVRDTNEAMGNYGEYNRPSFMRGAGGKFLTQFMMYPVHVTLFLFKNFKEMIKPMHGRTRVEAAKKFFGTLGMTMILGGYTALPWVVQTIIGLLGAMWKSLGDEDKEMEELRKMDFPFWFRTVWMQEQLGGTKIGGKSLADILERGPVNALTGVDVSSRTSLNNLWMRDTKEYKNVRENAMAMAMEKAGPSANMILSWAEAYEAFMQGDYKKGVQKATPAGFRNFYNAYELWQEGAKDNKGVELLSKDAFSTGELLGQAIGFRSDTLSNLQATTFKVTGLQQRIMNERNLLLTQLKREYAAGNAKAYAKYMRERDEFNKEHPSFAITQENLTDAIEASGKERSKSYRGFVLTEKNVPVFGKALVPSRRAAAEQEEAARIELRGMANKK